MMAHTQFQLADMVSRNRPPRFGKSGSIILYLLLFLVFGAAVGIWALATRGGTGGAAASDQFTVQRGAFDITIPAIGDLAALSQVEIRNQLESRAVITFIVPEGTVVKAGEVLVRLNDDDIETNINQAREALNSARNSVQNAIANLENSRSLRQSGLAAADLDIELAQLALDGWLNGEVVSRRATLRLEIETSEKDVIRLKDRYEDSKKLHQKGFISEDELRSDEIQWIRAEAKLQEAVLAQKVFDEYTFKQDEKKKNSDLEQAIQERERLENRLNANVASAESDLESAQLGLGIRQERLDKLMRQLESCIIRAPSDGLVVYASSLNRDGWGRNDGQPPQVGTELSRNEPVIILPDTSNMVAAVKVNEALVGQIRPGQRATVRSDALPNVTLEGEVFGIGVLAEGGGWRDPNRRDYTVRIKLLNFDTSTGLKPSMRAQASIYTGRVEDSLYVPVQATFRRGPLAFVYVPQGGGYAQQQVTLGRSSELYVEIRDGLKEGDRILLREPDLKDIVSQLQTPTSGTVAGQSPSSGAAEQSDISTQPAQATDDSSNASRPNPGGDRPRGQRPNRSPQ